MYLYFKRDFEDRRIFLLRDILNYEVSYSKFDVNKIYSNIHSYENRFGFWVNYIFLIYKKKIS